MKRLVMLMTAAFAALGGLPGGPRAAETPDEAAVYVIPIRDDIAPPMLYLVRRGVKEAIAAKAAAVVLDMNTNGGRVDTTEEILKALEKFEGLKVTYVNDRAFSAGAFIAAGTKKIYMAPGSVIGAAAPIMMVPGGGAQEMGETMEIKMTSAVRALVRRTAERQGHRPDVFEAMVDRRGSLEIDGETIKEDGDILTLTDSEAAREYGEPPRPLLSSGTAATLTEVLEELELSGLKRVRVEPTGAEQIATWINKVAPLLMMVGLLGLYLEFKAPGFGVPGIVGVIAFLLYFFGGYIAGLAGLEWLLIFLLGLALVAVEIFFLPGTIVFAVSGAGLMIVALVMRGADVYPGGPLLPPFPELSGSLRDVAVAVIGSMAIMWLLGLWLPHSKTFGRMISSSVSGGHGAYVAEETAGIELGAEGVAVSRLTPGGRARFGDRIVDVSAEGEMIEEGAAVKVAGRNSSNQLLVSQLG